MENNQQASAKNEVMVQEVKPNKPKKGLSLLTVLGIIAIFGIGVGVGWFLSVNSRQNNGPTKQQATSIKQDNKEGALVAQPAEVIAKIKTTYAAKYTLLAIDENSNPASSEMSIGLNESAPAYKVEGYDFYTIYDGGSGIDLIVGDASKDTDMTVRTEIEGIFKNFGLSKTETRGVVSDGDAVDIYTNKDLICQVNTPATNAGSTSASCGTISAYTTTAQKIKPIADVMTSVESSTILSALKIIDSSVSGYQRASLAQNNIEAVGGFVSLLYKGPSGQWVYFKGTQDSVPCADFNTIDLKNAFKGESCFDAANEKAIVQ